MDFIAIIATFVQAHPWSMVVLMALYALSEAVPHFPNIKANSTVQLVVNGLQAIKAKLSLKPAAEAPKAIETPKVE